MLCSLERIVYQLSIKHRAFHFSLLICVAASWTSAAMLHLHIIRLLIVPSSRIRPLSSAAPSRQSRTFILDSTFLDDGLQQNMFSSRTLFPGCRPVVSCLPRVALSSLDRSLLAPSHLSCLHRTCPSEDTDLFSDRTFQF